MMVSIAKKDVGYGLRDTENIRKHIANSGVKAKQLFTGTGCDDCRGSGYMGRMGIYELLVIDDGFRDMINRDSSVSNMRRVFRQSGQPGLFEDGMIKVRQGLTTIEEVLRVTEVYGDASEAVSDKNLKPVQHEEHKST